MSVPPVESVEDLKAPKFNQDAYERINLHHDVPYASRFVRQKAIDYIDRNLFSTHLRPSTVADGIHVSRAVLYRAFQLDGGVACFLHERRLSKARLMLEARAGEPGIVLKVASAHGYSNASRFSRLFASRFAEQPTQFVRKIRASADRTEPSDS